MTALPAVPAPDHRGEDVHKLVEGDVVAGVEDAHLLQRVVDHRRLTHHRDVLGKLALQVVSHVAGFLQDDPVLLHVTLAGQEGIQHSLVFQQGAI